MQKQQKQQLRDYSDPNFGLRKKTEDDHQEKKSQVVEMIPIPKQVIVVPQKPQNDKMFSNFQMTLNNHLKKNFKEDKYLQVDNLVDCVRIVEKSTKPWSKEKWTNILDKYSCKDVGMSSVNLQIKLQVPNKLRPRIWFWITNLTNNDSIPTYEQFVLLKELPSDYDQIILQDVERTFPQLPFFKGGRKKKKKTTQVSSQQKIEDKQSVITKSDDQEDDIMECLGEGQRKLFLVLRAYSNYDTKIGYTQGMNYLAAAILFHLIPLGTRMKNQYSFGDPEYTGIDQEYRTFQILFYICHQHNWREVYSRKMKKIKSLLSFLEQQLQKVVPEVAEKIKQQNLPFHIFFDSYFFTVMMYRSPMEFCARILDIFILEGENVIFEVILRMLFFNRKKIEQMKETEDILSFFKQDLVSITLSQFTMKQIIPLNHLEVINEC